MAISSIPSVWSDPGASFGDAISLGESAGFGKSNLGGGGSSMINPWLAGASLGVSVFEGFLNRGAQERNAANQLALGKFGFDVQRQTGLDVGKGNLGLGLHGPLVAERNEALAFQRQLDAKRLEAGLLGDAFREAKRRDMQADFGFRTSAPFREAEQRANRELMKQDLAQRQAQMMGMLGRIAPQIT